MNEPRGSASDASQVALLEIKGLNQFYGESHTLWDIDLALPEGACTVLMGRNGVGKTTLLQCIMGLLPVTSGTMRYADNDLLRTSAEQRARSSSCPNVKISPCR